MVGLFFEGLMADVIIKKEEIRVPNYDITAGDLADAVGKIYMKDLWNAIERNVNQQQKVIYFLTAIRKNPKKLTEIHIKIKPLLEPLFLLRESMDFWKFDYEKEELKLIWSVPHRAEMKTFLRSPELYSKELIRWIRQYLDQENINLNDTSAQAIK
jgi:hypothetical protein